MPIIFEECFHCYNCKRIEPITNERKPNLCLRCFDTICMEHTNHFTFDKDWFDSVMKSLGD